MYVSYNTNTNLLLQAARIAIDNTLQSVFKVSRFTQLLLRGWLWPCIAIDHAIEPEGGLQTIKIMYVWMRYLTWTPTLGVFTLVVII